MKKIKRKEKEKVRRNYSYPIIMLFSIIGFLVFHKGTDWKKLIDFERKSRKKWILFFFNPSNQSAIKIKTM